MSYSIYENTTGVLLVDNLSFEEAAEQSSVYMNFFETDDITVVANNNYQHTYSRSNIPFEYKSAFVDYFAELQEMGNLL